MANGSNQAVKGGNGGKSQPATSSPKTAAKKSSSKRSSKKSSAKTVKKASKKSVAKKTSKSTKKSSKKSSGAKKKSKASSAAALSKEEENRQHRRTLAQFLPLILRLTIGATVLFFGLSKLLSTGGLDKVLEQMSNPETGSVSIYIQSWLVNTMGIELAQLILPIAILEVLIGTCLILGLFTRLAATLNAVVLYAGIISFSLSPSLVTLSREVAIIGLSIALLYTGPGKGSLDAVVRKRKTRLSVHQMATFTTICRFSLAYPLLMSALFFREAFMFPGVGKVVTFPVAIVIVFAIALLLTAGLGTRVLGFLLCLVFIVDIVGVGFRSLLDVVLLSGAISVLVLGTGRFSIDAFIRKGHGV